jgi:hypothetical protein
MHPNRFDAMARSVAPIRSRRALFGLAAGAVAMLGGADLTSVKAQPRAKKKCPSGHKTCKNKCCKSGELCVKGTCVTGKADCNIHADSCQAGVICHCGQKEGVCSQRLQGGVRCAIEIAGKTACDQCSSDADCPTLGFPPGSSCVKDSGPACPLCPAANTLGKCVAPCNAEA